MEILLSIAYFFLTWLVFFEYRWLPWNLLTSMITFCLYGAAVLMEIILLGQFTPYSDEVFVQRPVVQIATYLGGQIKEIYVKPNEIIKKGAPLYRMDKTSSLASLDKAKADLARIKIKLDEAKKLAPKNAIAADMLTQRMAEFDAAAADVAKYQYRVDQTVTYAPSDGYVINMQLRSGQFVSMKQPVMAFVSTEEAWLAMKVRQEGSQGIKKGQTVEFALTMYPGEVFSAKVNSLIKGVGEAQLPPDGTIPKTMDITKADHFFVKIDMDPTIKQPLIFGASGIAAINTGGPDVFWLLRRIEIQTESFLNYLYNPFSS
jgi:multidrug resistance efflux pump